MASGKSPVEVLTASRRAAPYPFVICVGRENEPSRVRRSILGRTYSTGSGTVSNPACGVVVNSIPASRFDGRDQRLRDVRWKVVEGVTGVKTAIMPLLRMAGSLRIWKRFSSCRISRRLGPLGTGKQIQIDAGHWKAIRFGPPGWSAVIGAIIQQWLLIVGGLIFLADMRGILTIVVRPTCDAPIVIGVVNGWDREPYYSLLPYR